MVLLNVHVGKAKAFGYGNISLKITDAKKLYSGAADQDRKRGASDKAGAGKAGSKGESCLLSGGPYIRSRRR